MKNFPLTFRSPDCFYCVESFPLEETKLKVKQTYDEEHYNDKESPIEVTKKSLSLISSTE